MLTNEQQYILDCLYSSLNANKPEPCNALPFDDNEAKRIIQKNGILLTIYRQLSPSLQALLSSRYLAGQKQAIIQNYEGNRVLHALSDAGLDCIALKGWELRKLYSDITMRQMADLDILVKPYDFEQIKSVMKKQGYSASIESSWKHDSFKKKEVRIEMHKRLTDDSEAIQAWERGIWGRAVAVDGNIYRMSPEDYYIFHFVHLHKDFMNGSLGLRRIVDTWLLQKQSVDMDVVKGYLVEFGMWKFYERMVKLSLVAMGEKPIDEDSELLLTHTFAHGIYGSGKSYKAGRIVTMGGSIGIGEIKSMLAAVFLPYKRMKAQYPILEKCPILLPYYWLKRIVRFMKGDKKKYSRMLDYSDVKPEDLEEMKRFFEAGGVSG